MSVLADFALPFLRCLDPEKAHNMTLAALKMGLGPKAFADEDGRLVTKVWDMYFPNPIGLSAGFDKNAEVADAMLETGLGFVEVGSITPKAQDGNPKPRIFRLPKDGGVINRLGFNNKGMQVAAKNLAHRHGNGIVGVNLGKNKTTEDAASDYAIGAEKLSPFADYLVINVSSPNTPGLRALQDKTELANLVAATLEARDKAMGEKRKPPLLVKIAPDLNDDDLSDIASLALEMNIDGLIISNTTISRPDTLKDKKTAEETGGLSGKPLMELSTEVLADVYKRTDGKIPLIGVGGVASGQDAYLKIRAGASLVQLYSALVYHGPSLIPRIKRELSECLARDGFENVGQAVGADHR
ncbi:quinone-dependent dihydroorotate dehydrogenase [Curvivirga sp.]|uniref:quinone-dependent dihydroorotate dehydrogenase n=1 Tax=Curvivirga sp. TaxID=2856848 RepID=UPI003B5BDF54